MATHVQRICGGSPTAVFAKQPYYLKHSPGHPSLGCVHDGTSTDYGKGFVVKPISWLYRFRWNTTHRGATPLYLKNPGGKVMHWLEVSSIKKGLSALLNDEAYPHLVAGALVVAFTAWQIGRYALFHPELTMYMLAMYPTKIWITQHRYNERHPMDKPVFRWGQRAPEFYWYDPYRDLIKLGVIANDPYVDYMKSIGKGKELTLYMDEKGWGEGGRGKLTELLPREWRQVKTTEPHH